ncbi:hypothetical protein [Pectobacterium polaris]|uniref:hypothetical protein n=1 Tax=Pectobacterium polaris TaxID=2042057 RepID=UPI000F8CF855|nr:hypothetical protein [Pectobacterium polaris]RUR96869.1 hypothetical protein KHDHEBDM_02452 [Pectobacterium polaris]
MSERLLIAVLGNRNSGKSTTWNRLFGSTVKTGKYERPLFLNDAQWVNVFLVSGSPEEREIEVGEILPESVPQIVLCSTQYREDVTETFDYFFRQGYEVFVQWLNPGYSDDTPYDDNFFLRDYLLENGATIQIRDGQADPTYRLKDIRQLIFGWASYRNLIVTKFP